MEERSYASRERFMMIGVVTVTGLVVLAWMVNIFSLFTNKPLTASATTTNPADTRAKPLSEELRGEAKFGIETMRSQWSDFQKERGEQKAFADFVQKQFTPKN